MEVASVPNHKCHLCLPCFPKGNFEIFCFKTFSNLDMPFAKWTKEQVCTWLRDQGLGSYINNGKHWILSGQTLLQASQTDLEKVSAGSIIPASH